MPKPQHPREVNNLRWSTARVPMSHWGQGLDAFKPYDDASERALSVAVDFVENFHQRWVNPNDLPEDRSKIGRGLVIEGTPGTGKTTLTTAVLTEVHARYNWKIHWQAYPEHIRNVIRAQRDDGLQEWADAVRQIARVNDWVLVVLDDVAKEHKTASGFAENETDRLLRTRFEQGKPTLISTNLPVGRWGEVYNPSMLSFVQEAYDIVTLTGKDQRRR